MKRKYARGFLSVAILFLLLAQAGCYAPAYYPSYDSGYGETGAYQGGYPAPGYGSNNPGGYGQAYQGYYGQDYGGQDYRDDDDDEEDDWGRSRDQYRPWQDNPYGGYDGR